MASKGDRRDRTELVLQETQVGEEHRRVSATVGEAEVAPAPTPRLPTGP